MEDIKDIIAIFPEEIYVNNLRVINGIKFTPREIDVIACILNGKTAKGIANFLSTDINILSERGIESHILNIRRKIGCNAKEEIINFIENSGKHFNIRNYYISLIIQKEFKQFLKELSVLIKPIISSNSFLIINYPAQENINIVSNKIQEHLKLLAVDNIVEIKQFSDSNIDVDIEEQYKIYLIHNNEQEIIEEIIKNNPQTGDYCIIINKVKEFIKNFRSSQDISDSSISKYIDLFGQTNYYYLFFEILKILFHNNIVNEAILKFKDKNKNLLENTNKNNYFIQETDLSTQIEIQKLKFFKKLKRPYIYSLLAICLATSGAYVPYNQSKEQKKFELLKSIEERRNIQTNIQETLPKFFKELTIRNLDKDQSEKNYNIIKQFDQVIKKIQLNQINEYFDEKLLNSKELVQSIYNLNAISAYFLFKEHDTEKAEKILNYAKSLAINYISRRSKVYVDFSQLTEAEIYTELLPIKDLSEMYATTVYFIGRMYIYRKNIEPAEKYFKLSKYLGSKLDLFIGFLSDIGGFGIIKSDQIDYSIKNGDYEKAKKLIQESLSIYIKAKKDNRRYKKDYRPDNYDPSIIIPKEDIYNIVECNKRIINLYIKLINITDNKDDNEIYLEEIINQFTGSNNNQGILDIIINSKDLLNRIAADSYNSIGNLLLKLYEKNISFKKLKNFISMKLHLTEGEDLNLIYQIFELAKSLSRNTEFTKADAYGGLVKVYEQLISINTITDQEKQELLEKIQKFKDQRDIINKELKRST